MLAAVLVTALVWAHAPLPMAAGAMLGSWDVKWGDFDVGLELRPGGSAHFRYVPGGGMWDGSWAYDP